MTEIFGRYVIEGRIAAGPTSTVFRAIQADTDRVVAIKELAPSFAARPEFRERFRVEARVLATFDHPNIVRIYDFVEEPDRSWLVEEWVDGAGLDLVAAAGRLTPVQSLGVLRGALSGLAHAHDAGVVHGDLKPQNILVDRTGVSKLVDFGLASRAGEGAVAEGTPGYIAPEVLDGRSADARADVYAAGIVLHELLAGGRLFDGEDAREVLAAQRRAVVPPIEGVSDELNALVLGAIATDPAGRPENAAAFLAELEDAATRSYGAGWLTGASLAGLATVALAGGASSSAATSTASSLTTQATASASKHAVRGVRRLPKKWLVAGGAATTAAVVAVVAVIALGGDSSPSDISGKWTATYKVKDAATGTGPVGSTVDNTWTMVRSCTGGSCKVTLNLPANDAGVPTEALLAQDGDTYSGRLITPQDCVDLETQEIRVKGSGRIVNHFRLGVTESANGRAEAFAGSVSLDVESVKPDTCPNAEDPHGEWAITGARPA